MVRTTFLPRTVVILGLVALLNDAASEMISPLLPLFLTATLGAGPAIVGLVEGVAEATASILRLVSGWLADRGWNIRRLVIGGYTLSNIARPSIGLAFTWSAVLLLRFVDRVGKGIRTAPRDALIVATCPPGVRGRAFGFHRSMDHLGAVAGPLLAFGLLAQGVSMADTFLVSGAIGAAVVGLLLIGLPDTGTRPAAQAMRFGPPAAARLLPWKSLDGRLRRLIVAAGVLALATTPEAFVVMWAHDQGLEIVWVPLLWAAASLAKSALALPFGTLSDRLGRRVVLIGGWSARVLALLALAVVPSLGPGPEEAVWVLFIAYSASLALTEAAERSLIGDVAPEHERGTAFGLYHLASGLLVLPGAVLFGSIWEWAGAAAAFAVAAGLAVLAILLMSGPLATAARKPA